MTIYELNKILSSENKAKLIIHFWNCHCQNHDVNYMVKKLNISQSNLSKHIGKLLHINALKYKTFGKERYYYINPQFKIKWKKIINPQIELQENNIFQCSCCSSCQKISERKHDIKRY